MRMSRSWQIILLVAWAIFIGVVRAVGHGVRSITYPHPVRAVEIVSIIGIFAAPILLAFRLRIAAAVLGLSCLGGIVVAIWDARVPGQGGPLEIAVFAIVAALALVALLWGAEQPRVRN
jgi:hypothetical protein